MSQSEPTNDRSEELIWLSTMSLLIIGAVALATALVYTRTVMVPFVLAIFFYYLVSPIVDGMQIRWRMPRGISIFVALVLVIGILTLLVLLITVSSQGLSESAPIYRERLASIAESLFSVLDRFDLDLGQDDVLQGLQQLPILNIVRSTAGTVVSFLTNGFLVLVFVIFLLGGRDPRGVQQGIYGEIDQKIRRYIVTKVATSAVTGTLVGAILGILGVDLAFVFGVLAFFLNFIPNVGSVFATLLPLPLAFFQFDSAVRIGLVAALPGAVQMTVGNVIEPKLMGEGLDLHPISILLALVFWGLLWGVVGMLLAAPMTAALRIVLDRFETTRPIANVLAGRLSGNDAA